MHRLISIIDKNFTDNHWGPYFNLMEDLHKRYKSDLVAASWQDLKSRNLSFAEKEKVYDKVIIYQDDHPVGWMYFWILNYNLPGQMPLIEFNALYDTLPQPLILTMTRWFVDRMIDASTDKAFNPAVDQRLSLVSQQWGGKQLGRLDKYILRVDMANEELISEWLRTLPESNKDLRIEFYRELPDERLPDIADLLTESLQDMPEEQESDMPYVANPDSLREQIRWRRQNKNPLYSCLVFNRDDDIVAISSVEVNLSNTKNISQGMTGVARKYRRRGLAKWLKAALMNHLREQFPGIETFTTSMRAVNEPIQSINARVGFTLEQQGHEYRVTRDNLERYLRDHND